MEYIKKQHISLLALLLISATAFGQTWDEIFKQKETQKRYLLEQISALKLYTGYLKKGYEVATNGLNTVGDIKNGEFSLHNAFFNSLKNVAPSIRNDGRVAEIIGMQLSISRSLSSLKQETLPAIHQRYIRDVKEHLLGECGDDLEELLLVITSGKVEMTDDERLKRLDKVYTSMQDKSAFVQSFAGQVALIARNSANEQRSINQLRRYYENH